MKFTKLLTNLIVEQSRFQVLYDKFVKPPTKGGENKGVIPKNVMDFDTLKKIIFADPTTKKPDNFDVEGASSEDMENVKVGKYTQWLIKNFVSPNPSELRIQPNEEGQIDINSREYKNARKEYERLFMEDLYKQTERLEFYEKSKQYLPLEYREINKLTVNTLFDILKDFKLPEKKTKEIEKKEAKKTRQGFKHAGGEIIFEGPNWTLIRISDTGSLGRDAAIWYGGFKEHRNGESDWCTSSPGLRYFEGYIKDGPLYVVLPNDDKGQVGEKTGLPKERYQFHFPSDQFMDRDDRQVNLVQMLNGPMVELKDFFKPEFAKGLVNKGGTKVEINYPDSSTGKFVALYGFNELFENLPDNIEHLIINNKSKDDIALDVPKSISRFTNLQALLLENIVKTLPENIGDLKSLSFIALPNNNKLEKLPETIADISNLAFINLSGCSPSLNIPTRLKEKLIDEGNGFYYLS
jgi:hypothetical protein